MADGLNMSRRIRRTPYTDRVEALGVRGFSVVNHMLLPKAFETSGSLYPRAPPSLGLTTLGVPIVELFEAFSSLGTGQLILLLIALTDT